MTDLHVLSATGLTQQHDDRVLFHDVSLGIRTGDRIGVVGPNGSGKSTLLRILAGIQTPTSGEVVHANGARIAWLPQAPELPDTLPVEAVVSTTQAIRPHEAEAMLDRLGVPLDLPTGSMSGGQLRRVALAAALLPPADLLVLDEPTNHLDVWTVDWLEEQVRARAGALLLVTHDRRMLESLTTRMLELDPDGVDPTGTADAAVAVARAGGGAYWHEGSYSVLLEARAERGRRRKHARDRRDAVLRKEIAWLRRQPKARTSKPKFRVEQAEALQAATPAGERGQLQLGTGRRRLGSRVIDVEGASFRYEPDAPDIVRGLDLLVGPGDRLGVVGPNGAGKTTLLRLLTGDLQPTAGSVAHGTTVELGVYDQHATVGADATDATVLDTIHEVGTRIPLANGETLTASALAERFLFDPRLQRTRVGDLSGGERRRLALLRLLVAAPNVLVLDEPTNDLDLDTLGLLEDHLDGFAGTLLVASHDRFVLDRLTDGLLAVEVGGDVTRHLDWDHHREAVQAREADAQRAESAAAARRPPGAATHDPREERRQARRAVRQAEDRMARLEGLRDQLDAALAAAAGRNHEQAAELATARSKVVDELSEAEEEWLSAAASLEVVDG